METGVGRCPDHLSVCVTLSTASSMQFIPWMAVNTNSTRPIFGHPTFNIPPPSFLNKTVMADLDATFQTLNGDLRTSIAMAEHEIDGISETSTTSYTSYVAFPP